MPNAVGLSLLYFERWLAVFAYLQLRSSSCTDPRSAAAHSFGTCTQ